MNATTRALPLISSSLLLIMAFALIGCGGAASDSGPSEEAFYPIDFASCPEMTLTVGSSMIPYTHVHEGITIKFCCKPCLPKFQKDPEKYMVIHGRVGCLESGSARRLTLPKTSFGNRLPPVFLGWIRMTFCILATSRSQQPGFQESLS